jgi:hypothetical protein
VAQTGAGLALAVGDRGVSARAMRATSRGGHGPPRSLQLGLLAAAVVLVGALVGCLAGSADAPEEFVPVTRPARVEVSALLRATALPLQAARARPEAVADR